MKVVKHTAKETAGMSKGDLPFGILVPWIDVLCFHLPSGNEFAPCLWQKKAFAGRRRAKVRAQCKWRGRPKPASPLLEAEPHSDLQRR
jgi:hypothetical protein